MEDAPFPSTMRYERVVLGALLRVVPVVVGLVIALSFGASVLHDPVDLAHGAWYTGGQIFGLYADFVRGAILPGIVLLGIARHADERRVRIVAITAEAIVLVAASGKVIQVARRSVRAFAWEPIDDGASVILELDDGVGALGITGDRLTLTLGISDTGPMRELLRGLPSFAVIAREQPALGWLRAVVTLLLGVPVGHFLYTKLVAAVALLPRPSDYVPQVPDAAHGWYWGLLMTCAGTFYLLARWLMRERRASLDDKMLVYEKRASSVRVRFDDIETAERDGDTVRVTKADGQVIEVASSVPGAARTLSVALAERLTDDAPVPAAPASLVRGEAPIASWRQRIQRDAAVGSYRDLNLDDDHLVACLEAPHVSRDVRVGAAIALVARGDDAGRERVRVAAMSSRNAALRSLLERIAEGEAEEEELSAALEPRSLTPRRSR